MSVFNFDYLYITKSRVVSRRDMVEGEDVVLQILVARDSQSRAVFAHAVPSKSPSDGLAVNRLLEDVQWLGHTRIALRSDNEPAIVALLKRALCTVRVHVEDLEQVIEEHPAAYDSQAQGEIENAVKRVTGLLRTHKLCLERRLGKKMPSSHPLMTWLVEFVAWLINVRIEGNDGKTAYHRVRGRPYAKRLVGFGEVVQYNPP